MSYPEYNSKRIIDTRNTYNQFMTCYPFSLDDIDGEIWAELPPCYAVSNFGRIKSFARHEPRILKPQLFSFYLIADFRHRLGFRRFIHRLVAEYFIPNPDNKQQVNHIDGHKFNNHVSNLEWCTQSENIQHSLQSGLKKSGENNYLAVFSNEQAKWIRSVYKPYDKEFGAIPLARALGVSEATVRAIVSGKHYKFI